VWVPAADGELVEGEGDYEGMEKSSAVLIMAMLPSSIIRRRKETG
jgi:hypothetical protein